MNWQDFDFHNYLLLPLIIFLARTIDTSLGTLRIVMISRGNRKAVRLVGFVEVLLWIIAIGQIIQNLNNWAGYLAWAAGFSVGSMIGFKIEDRLALGKHQLRIITSQPVDRFLSALKEINQGFTVFDGMGATGPVKQVFLILNRQNNKEVTALVNKHIPTSFCSVSDVMATDSGVFNSKKRELFNLSGLLLPLKKK
ncbi:MAG: hypothetical protein ACI9UR_002019 [Bacteroidia bacterium]|jgi:uncharacterized protein YebE (UPF0316 family)